MRKCSLFELGRIVTIRWRTRKWDLFPSQNRFVDPSRLQEWVRQCQIPALNCEQNKCTFRPLFAPAMRVSGFQSLMMVLKTHVSMQQWLIFTLTISLFCPFSNGDFGIISVPVGIGVGVTGLGGVIYAGLKVGVGVGIPNSHPQHTKYFTAVLI